MPILVIFQMAFLSWQNLHVDWNLQRWKKCKQKIDWASHYSVTAFQTICSIRTSNIQIFVMVGQTQYQKNFTNLTSNNYRLFFHLLLKWENLEEINVLLLGLLSLEIFSVFNDFTFKFIQLSVPTWKKFMASTFFKWSKNKLKLLFGNISKCKF